MIFVTVGSADPFDRLIRAIDEWAGARARNDVFAQIGRALYQPRYMKSVAFLSPSEFRDRVRAAHLIVAHAGIGSIFSALEAGTPIIVMPKWARLGEHRNDHQVATARYFGGKPGVTVAHDEKDLVAKLEQEDVLASPCRITLEASPELASAIRSFIRNCHPRTSAKRPGLRLPWTRVW